MTDLYTPTYWRQKGAECARRGFGITSVLTADKNLNALIREGFAAEEAKTKPIGKGQSS